MSAASAAAAFVRRRRRRLCGGGDTRHYPRLLRWSSLFVPQHHLSSAPEIEPSTEHHQKNSGILPWLMLSSPSEPQSRFLYRLSLDDHQFKLDKALDLPEIAGNRCIGVSQGYLLTVPARCSPDVVAVNPLTKSRLPLPSSAGLPDLPVSDTPLTRHKNLLLLEEQATVDSNHYGLFYGRAFLAPSLDAFVLLRYNFEHEPFYARLSSLSSPWIRLNCRTGRVDCVSHKGQFLAVEEAGNIVLIKEFDQPPLFMPKNLWPDIIEPDLVYLVETPDREELFLVNRGRHDNEAMSPVFEVFWLDKKDKYRWKEVDSLGGLTFFVGANQSVSVLAADFPGLVSDAIYFTDDAPFGMFPSAPGRTGIFSLRDRTLQFFRFTDEEVQLNWPPPMWYAPHIA